MATQAVLEYNCPCCGAGLMFAADLQKLKCEYCDNEFDLETVKAYEDSGKKIDGAEFQWEEISSAHWSDDDAQTMHTFICQSCGGVLITDENTAATFCPYCENPTIVEGRVCGELKPDSVIPFQKTKEDAMNAFLALCKDKPLLPKAFTEEHRLEKISGMYVPFWLYDCDGSMHCTLKATRLHRWSDMNYNYTRTDHYLLNRDSYAAFTAIPMDASSKIDNAIMESIEPYDYSQLVSFEKAYLSGYLADKYDVEASEGESRIKERASQTLMDTINSSIIGYASAVPTAKQLQIHHGKAKYVLLPVWMLHTKYGDKTYVFAMNGQTGKMTGTFPICPKRSAAWFASICAGVTALVSIATMLFG